MRDRGRGASPSRPTARPLYTANGPSNDVSVIDWRPGRSPRRFRSGDGPWGLRSSSPRYNLPRVGVTSGRPATATEGDDVNRQRLIVIAGLALVALAGGMVGATHWAPRLAAQTRAAAKTRQLAAPQPRPRRQPLLAAGPDQPVERQDADAALALPARRHRRRQQPDDAGRRRRHDVRDRFARQRLRRRRGRRPSAVDLRRHATDRRRRARRLRLPQPRRHLRRRRRLHGRRVVPLRARREDRQADPELRQGRPGQRHPRRAEAALSAR